MKSQRITALLVAALMFTGFACAELMRPTKHLADQRPKVSLESLFPKEFGGWHIDDRQVVQLVSPDQQATLARLYTETLSRTYVNAKSGQRVMLAVAYGGDQSDGSRAHLPEMCYPAQGFEILSRQVGTLQTADFTIPVQRMVAKLGSRIEPISYWLVVGDRVALTGPQLKFAQLQYTLRGVIPDGTLIRVSNIDDRQSPVTSYAIHDEFLREMAAAIPESLRSRVIGRPNG